MEIVALHLVLILFAVDVWHNTRIIRAYARMGKMTSTNLAVTEQSREGFRRFFPLCGWGTHGVHVIHLSVDVLVVASLLWERDNLSLTLAGSLILALIGLSILHWKEAEAAEAVVESFFSRDLPILAGIALDGDQTLDDLIAQDDQTNTEG